MRLIAYACAALVLLSGTATAQCLRPDLLRNSIVKLEGMGPTLDKTGQALWQGTGWYRTSHHVVTNAHVVKSMELLSTWKSISIQQGAWSGHSPYRDVRVIEYAGKEIAPGQQFDYAYTESTDLAVIELRTSFPFARPLTRLRSGAAFDKERLLTVGFPEGEWRWVDGISLIEKSYKMIVPQDLLFAEFEREGNRLVVVPGASGSLVLDCMGRVVGTISMVCCPREVVVGGKSVEILVPSLPGAWTNQSVAINVGLHKWRK